MKIKFDNFHKGILLIMAFMVMSVVSYGQRTISGTIIDNDTNEPLIGASVLVVGTTTGTITDIDGSYSLNVPADATAIEVSYTGYGTQVFQLGATNVMDVKLGAGEILDEVVVVGYGSVKKRDATGALTQVGEEDFNRGVIVSPEQLIQGRAAGVQITSSSGAPGAGVNVRIRGTSSVRNGNNPLFVVDGVPIGGTGSSPETNAGLGRNSDPNPLNFLNPNDIESMDILKDASATAIYGSRGANGVVIITTKSGKASRGVLDYQYGIGFGNISKRYDLLSADEFAAQNPDQDLGGDTDWQDEIFRTSITHNHNLAFGDGNEKGDYRFSLSFLDQEGIIETSELQRLSARFNGSRKFINDKLTISTQFTVANTEVGGVPITENSGFEGDLLAAALKSNPTLPLMDVNDLDGDGITDELSQPSETEPSPVAILEFSRDEESTVRFLGNISANYAFTDKFSFKTLVGLDRATTNRNAAFSPELRYAQGIFGNGRLFVEDASRFDRLWENYFTYTDKFGGNVDFTALAGYSYQEFTNTAGGFEFTNFRTNDLDLIINNFASADLSGDNNSIAPLNSFSETDELQSFFGRVNLGFSDKYLITASLRADGSTRFGPGNRYGVFPSAAFKWKLVEESFIPDGIADLGLRLGWGITGNQEIPHNLFEERQRYGNWDIDSGGNFQGGGLGTVAFANPDLKWESTSQINVGLDFAFFDYKLSGSLDLYRKNTNDLLFQINAAQPAVSPFVWTNLDADVINQGIELALNAEVVNKSAFRWDVNFNIAYNDNRVENLIGVFDTGEINGQGLTGAFVQRIANGQPLYAFFLREFGGFDDAGNSIYPNGDFQEFVGASPLPKVTSGLTNTFKFGDVDFSFFFTGQFGHSVYSNTANAFFTAGSLANGRNVTTDVVGNGEGQFNAPDVSTRFLQDASFVRLQNVSLGYNINTKNINNVSKIRLFATGQNLFVITQYDGQDPEVDTNKSLNGIPSAGIDYTPYPRVRTITIGANVAF